MFRASHRAECDPAGSARAAATLPDAPFHSFTAAAAQPLKSGEAARLRFQLLPTAYCFAKVHMESCYMHPAIYICNDLQSIAARCLHACTVFALCPSCEVLFAAVVELC